MFRSSVKLFRCLPTGFQFKYQVGNGRTFSSGLVFRREKVDDSNIKKFKDVNNKNEDLVEKQEPGKIFYDTEYVHPPSISPNKVDFVPFEFEPELHRLSPVYSKNKKKALRTLKLPEIPVPSIIEATNLFNGFVDEKKLYCVLNIKGRKIHAGLGDVICSDWISDVVVGDVIELDRISEIGGKNFTIKGKPFISPVFFSIKGIVIERTSSLEHKYIKRLTKSRKFRYDYTHYTLIRIYSLKLKNIDLNSLPPNPLKNSPLFESL